VDAATADGDPDMEAAVNTWQQRTRGDELLLHHCLTVGGSVDERVPALTRLEDELGAEMARLLVLALSPAPQGRRGSSSP
jgi:hypothetical protein